MSRVLHVFCGPYPTEQGTQVLVGRICRLSATRGDEVHLLCYAHARFAPDEPFEIHRIPNVPRFESTRSGLAWQKPVLDLEIAVACRRLLSRARFDLVHAHHFEALFAARLASPDRRVPLLFHVHALLRPELAGYLPRALRAPATLLGGMMDGHAWRLCDHLVAVSESVRDLLVEAGTPAGMITVGPPPCEPAPEIRETTDRPPGPLAVYSGNLDAYQGLETLLRAMVLSSRGGASNVRLRIATASDTRRLEREIARLGLRDAIELFSHDEAGDAWRCLEGADFAVVPRSSAGGFPMKAQNALAAGVPLIADRAVFGELTHGENAWLVDMRDPEALARAMVDLAADSKLRARLRDGGMEATRTLFSKERYLERLDEASRLAMSRHRAR